MRATDAPLTRAEATALRHELIRALEHVEQAAAHLRHHLRTLETMLRRTRDHYEHEGHVAELPRVGDVPRMRADMTAAITEFERARRHARVTTAHLATAEGTTIGAVARMFGISRQSLSRLTHQAVSDDANT